MKIRAISLAAIALLLMQDCAVGQNGPFRLGTTTHFSQGWPDRLWPLVRQVGAVTVRDSIHWRKVERVQGHYNFTADNSGHIQRACDAGIGVVLGLDPRNHVYDGGQTSFTPVARMAYANYVKAIADKFGGCIVAVEVGNEINGLGNVTGPAALDRAVSHTALLRDVYRIAKPGHSGLAILGGSTNAIGTGFLIDLFNAGALSFMDGVAVHPYRQDPVNLDWELNRLTAAMAARGMPKPIWATEFSREFASPAQAPGFLTKMAALMSASGVRDALWYALADQKAYPTMGLFTFDGSSKPVATSFRNLVSDILPRGAAQRLNKDESGLFHFRFGTDRQIIWGARRTFSLSGPALIRDSTGTLIAQLGTISDDPIIIEGNVAVKLGSQTVLADSFYDYGKREWVYTATRGSGASIPLRPIDWKFGSYIGHPALKPIVVNSLGLAPAGGGRLPIKIMLRHTLLGAGPVYASGCIARKTIKGDGVTFELLHDGKAIAQSLVGANPYQFNEMINAGQGDSIDFVVGPNKHAAGDLARYRFRVSRYKDDPAPCS